MIKAWIVQWKDLVELIQEYADAQEAESWKGGGNPADYEILELTLELARAKLNKHIAHMRRIRNEGEEEENSAREAKGAEARGDKSKTTRQSGRRPGGKEGKRNTKDD